MHLWAPLLATARQVSRAAAKLHAALASLPACCRLCRKLSAILTPTACSRCCRDTSLLSSAPGAWAFPPSCRADVIITKCIVIGLHLLACPASSADGCNYSPSQIIRQVS
jgi:hypothetical protein